MDGRVTMVSTTLRSLHCSKTPKYDFFMVNEWGDRIIDFLHMPQLPTNSPTQVDMKSLQVSRDPPFRRTWDCKWTQMDEETPASTEEHTVQTDDHPSYGTTNYWLNISSGP
jgi:hypothetical protein